MDNPASPPDRSRPSLEGKGVETRDASSNAVRTAPSKSRPSLEGKGVETYAKLKTLLAISLSHDLH